MDDAKRGTTEPPSPDVQARLAELEARLAGLEAQQQRGADARASEARISDDPIHPAAGRAAAPASREGSDDPAERPIVAPGETRPASRNWVRRGLFLLLPLLLIAGAYWYVRGGQVMSIDDAYVEADKVGVSTDVSGIVKDVDVTENQHVAAGQVLYRLDNLQFALALAGAEAQVGMVRDALDALKANHRDMQAQIQQAQVDVDYYATEFRRQQTLLSARIASQSAIDTARRNLDNAQKKLASLEQQLAAIAANLNGDPDGPVERNPRYLGALAQRDEAARELAHTVVKAAFAGTVTDVPSIAPGKYLAASVTAFYLVDTDHVWVDATPKETELTYVRAGQPVTVTVDTYPGMAWHGTVASISPAAAQEFSLLPAENTSGNWVKVVQRIPLRVLVDTRDRTLPPLRAGMSVESAIDTGHRRGLPPVLTAWFGGARQRP